MEKVKVPSIGRLNSGNFKYHTVRIRVGGKSRTRHFHSKEEAEVFIKNYLELRRRIPNTMDKAKAEKIIMKALNAKTTAEFFAGVPAVLTPQNTTTVNVPKIADSKPTIGVEMFFSIRTGKGQETFTRKEAHEVYRQLKTYFDSASI